MKKAIISLALCVLGTSMAGAASTPDTKLGGLMFAGNLNLVGASFDSSVTTKISQKATSSIGQSLSAQVAYGIPVTSNAVVFIGAKADFGDIKAGFVSPYDFSVSSSSSVYIEPGYSTDGGKSTMYFKLSQNSMTGNYSGDPAKGAKDGSTAFSGLGFGVGFRTMLEGNKFIQLEVNQVNYKESAISDGSLFKPQSTGITLGFGYKF